MAVTKAEKVPTVYDGTARYVTTVSLNGINFVMHFGWNSRDNHWYLSVHDADDAPLNGFTSRKLVAGWGVSPRSTDTDKPYGALGIDPAGHSDPGIDTLGFQDLLVFLPY